MNRSILIVICDFLLLSLFTFSTDMNHMADESTPPPTKVVVTIISLIVASMGLVKFSLMAAYSSTSFGIIFVVIFKIFHLRPARRKLLLEAEAATGAPAGYVSPAAASTPAL